MLSLIHEAFRNKISSILPAGAVVGYGDLDLIYRKVINCKGQKNLPIFGFSLSSFSEWIDNASTPLAKFGYDAKVPVDCLPLPDQKVAGVKLAPALLEYNCFYLSDKMVDINTFLSQYIYFNYKKVANVFTVDDPEIDTKYTYQIIYNTRVDISKKGNEYEIGYQYAPVFTVQVRGPIREINYSNVIKFIHADIYLNSLLAEIWNYP